MVRASIRLLASTEYIVIRTTLLPNGDQKAKPVQYISLELWGRADGQSDFMG